MANVANDLKRIKGAIALWDMWRSLHQEASDFSCPNRETFNDYSAGQRKNRHVYDSTAVIGLQQFSNRIQSSLMPPWVEWLNFVAGDEIPEIEKTNADKLLEQITKQFFSVINHSNFYTEIAPALVDLGIGTGAIAIEENPLGATSPIRFVNIPLAELYLEKPSGGAVENVWRKQKVKPEHIKQLWPQAKMTSKLEDMAKKPDSAEVILWNGQVYDPETKMYEHKVIYEAEKHEVFSQKFEEKRILVFRWHVTPQEVYGRGPIIQMLPDIRTVNIMQEFILRNAAIQTSGVYTGVNDGIFNPHTARIAPGSIIPVSSNASANPTLTPMTPSGNIGISDAILEKIQANINKALFSNPLGDMADPTKTATEIMIRNQEMLKD
ncbi:MAG: portal protein, partial [Candidatus Nezhaarchaeales archaeon]